MMNFSGMGEQFKHYLQHQQNATRKASCQAVTATVTTGWEGHGPKPTDAESPLNTVQTAVKRMVQAERHRSLLNAIGKLHDARKSNGKPVVYVPE